MIKSLFYLCVLALVSGMMFTGYAAEKEGKVKAPKMGKVRHVVAFKFKATASPEDIKKLVDSFADLKNKIPQIVTFETGTNHSPEKLNKGFTHGFLLTFKTEKDRDDYLVHPDHKAFGSSVGPLVDDVFVFDYTITK
jgi:hypothetical protein